MKNKHTCSPDAKRTYQEALRVYSAAQRKTWNIRVFRLLDGCYEAFPLGHPVPRDAELVCC